MAIQLENRLVPIQIRERIRKELEQFPTYRFMNEEDQKRYSGACSDFGFRDIKALNVPLGNFNLAKILFLNNNLGIRTACLPDLDLIKDNNTYTTWPILLKDNVKTPAVLIRSATDYNPETDYLAKQVSEIAEIKKFPCPFIIEGLKLKIDTMSPSGISFEKGERFKVIDAPDFAYENSRKPFSRVKPNYRIDWDIRNIPSNQIRTIVTRGFGLSTIYQSWCTLETGHRVSFLSLLYSEGRIWVIENAESEK